MFIALLGVLSMLLVSDLPVGSAPAPVVLSHFPSRLHAFVWRNWTLVPTDRIAQTIAATPEEVLALGKRMGLENPPRIPQQQWKRSALTIIRRNWHLLPYEQLLTLLGWTAEQMEFSLREDDFLYVKMGNLKPKCEPVRFERDASKTKERESEIAKTLKEAFPKGLPKTTNPLFQFVQDLSKPTGLPPRNANTGLRYCYSYFALYGDPLLEKDADPYPEGYLEKLANAGVSGVWLQGVLYKLAPYPFDPPQSAQYEKRLENLGKLVARAKRYGIGIYLYLNEPRSMPKGFFEKHPELKGVTEGDYSTLCTSLPVVKGYLTDSIASICRSVPDLAGFFTISASENLTHCWSHGKGADCPNCKTKSAGKAITEVNTAIRDGIHRASSKARLIAWDWAWTSPMAKEIIAGLPSDVAVMSVSEWDMPIKRGGIDSVVGEYSVSTVGPGERAKRHWAWAKERGLKAFAKIQAANSWEMSAVPYMPVLENTVQHALNLRRVGVDGIMLGWTLGGYPSPNLEAIAEVANLPESAIKDDVLPATMLKIATARYGEQLAPTVVKAWQGFSLAFREFPFHISLVYTAPMQFGVSNLLWEKPTGYSATMIGFPYDDLDGWRAVYPPDAYISQMRKVAVGFESAIVPLRATLEAATSSAVGYEAVSREMGLAETVAVHFASVANQARFVQLRRELEKEAEGDRRRAIKGEIGQIFEAEIELSKRLYRLQSQDSRIGFEASNQYYYVPIDLLEKIINCVYLRDHWLKSL